MPRRWPTNAILPFVWLQLTSLFQVACRDTFTGAPVPSAAARNTGSTIGGTIVRDIPELADFDPGAVIDAPPDRSKLAELFRRWEMHQLLRRLEDLEDVATHPGPPAGWCPDCVDSHAAECAHCTRRVSKKHLHVGRTFSTACWECARRLRKEEKVIT